MWYQLFIHAVISLFYSDVCYSTMFELFIHSCFHLIFSQFRMLHIFFPFSFIALFLSCKEQSICSGYLPVVSFLYIFSYLLVPFPFFTCSSFLLIMLYSLVLHFSTSLSLPLYIIFHFS